MAAPQFWNYILTDWSKNILYSGYSNNMADRLIEHWVGMPNAFSTRYNTYYLVWFETTKYVLNAIEREKEIKDWKREKRNALIAEMNPEWKFLNEELLGNWPPTIDQVDDVRIRRRHADNWGR